MSLNAVIFHIFSHVVRIMQPLCVCCVSPVSWAKIRWGGLGWARLRLWTAAQDGCRNGWEEPRPFEWGRMYACVCVCDSTAWVLVYTWLSIIVSYSERAQCVSVSLSPFRAPWESAELHSLCWHTGRVTSSNPVIVGNGGHGGWITEEEGERQMKRKEWESEGFTAVEAGRGEKERLSRVDKSIVGKTCKK